jgi:hypothetical protein
MHSFITKAFVSLLAFSQTLNIAQAYPGQDPARPTYTESAIDNGPGGVNKEVALVAKREVTISDFSKWGQGRDELGTTWSGYVKEPKNSGWNTDSIDAYTVRAYDASQCGPNPLPVLVAALWVPGVGVYLGSIPHGKMRNSGDMSAQVGFDGMLRGQAPILWEQVRDRTAVNTSKYHAEDMAMYMYEKLEKPRGPGYPPNSYMIVYGQYDKNDKVGPKPPCTGPTSPGSDGINPSCKTTLRNLGITVMWSKL